jgi:quinol-cytochrome oxidoreductase complex cytochrome b subunit
VALLLATLLLSFTGYLLPWDQLAYWAITVGTNIARAAPLLGEKVRFLLLGGVEIGQATLLRFYVLHCVVLPLVVLLLFSWHMWRVRKDGGLACVDRLALDREPEPAPPSKVKTYSLLGLTKGRTVHVETSVVQDPDHTVDSSPQLTRRLLAVALGTLLVCSALAVVARAPLEEPANPLVTPNPAKAPWYFLWLQELVTDTTIQLGGFTVNGALVGGILAPGILILLLAAWPYLDKSSVRAAAVWFAAERRRQDTVFLVVVALVLVLTIVGTFLRGPYWNFYWPWEAWPPTPRRF